MYCPKCGYKTQVLDSRPVPNGIRRRRSCGKCDHRFTTREIMWVELKVDSVKVRNDNGICDYD